ncbi:MAG: hypothetical protein AAFV53_22010 [Myxococcota bacterium]
MYTDFRGGRGYFVRNVRYHRGMHLLRLPVWSALLIGCAKKITIEGPASPDWYAGKTALPALTLQPGTIPDWVGGACARVAMEDVRISDATASGDLVGGALFCTTTSTRPPSGREEIRLSLNDGAGACAVPGEGILILPGLQMTVGEQATITMFDLEAVSRQPIKTTTWTYAGGDTTAELSAGPFTVNCLPASGEDLDRLGLPAVDQAREWLGRFLGKQTPAPGTPGWGFPGFDHLEARRHIQIAASIRGWEDPYIGGLLQILSDAEEQWTDTARPTVERFAQQQPESAEVSDELLVRVGEQEQTEGGTVLTVEMTNRTAADLLIRMGDNYDLIAILENGRDAELELESVTGGEREYDRVEIPAQSTASVRLIDRSASAGPFAMVRIEDRSGEARILRVP